MSSSPVRVQVRSSAATTLIRFPRRINMSDADEGTGATPQQGASLTRLFRSCVHCVCRALTTLRSACRCSQPTMHTKLPSSDPADEDLPALPARIAHVPEQPAASGYLPELGHICSFSLSRPLCLCALRRLPVPHSLFLFIQHTHLACTHTSAHPHSHTPQKT
jgi:hypothetical protein